MVSMSSSISWGSWICQQALRLPEHAREATRTASMCGIEGRGSRGFYRAWVLKGRRGTWRESRQSGNLLRANVIGDVEPLNCYRDRNKEPQNDQDGERVARHAGRKRCKQHQYQTQESC